MFKLKRAYEKPSPDDGFRILVDRRWPCRVFKNDAKIDLWMKDIAPSEDLFVWFSRDPTKWDEFRRRYWNELQHKGDLIDYLEEKGATGTVTLVYRAKDTRFNNARALLQFLEQRERYRQWREAA
jgi:uncharacterized protein YeaO (DUF488 family)